MTWLVSVLLLTATPERFVLSVRGVPVGALALERIDGGWSYQSTQYFDKEERVVSRQLPLNPPPETYYLARLPSLGCANVIEERAGVLEPVCITRRNSRRIEGAIARVPFAAGYEVGKLQWLEINASRFERSNQRIVAGGKPFAQGFVAEGRPLVAHMTEVQVAGGAAQPTDERCLTVAERAIGAEGGTLVLGVIVEEGRAWPHAWVRRDGRYLDVTLAAGDSAFATRRYIAFDEGHAGRLYLALLEGRVKL